MSMTIFFYNFGNEFVDLKLAVKQVVLLTWLGQ